MGLWLTIGGWTAAAVTGWLWLGARDDVARQTEACNTDKVAAVAEAERVARAAEREAADAEILRLNQRIADEANAREIAQEAARAAESRPPVVREVIRRVADANACMDTAIPADVIDAFRM